MYGMRCQTHIRQFIFRRRGRWESLRPPEDGTLDLRNRERPLWALPVAKSEQCLVRRRLRRRTSLDSILTKLYGVFGWIGSMD